MQEAISLDKYPKSEALSTFTTELWAMRNDQDKRKVAAPLPLPSQPVAQQHTNMASGSTTSTLVSRTPTSRRALPVSAPYHLSGRTLSPRLMHSTSRAHQALPHHQMGPFLAGLENRQPPQLFSNHYLAQSMAPVPHAGFAAPTSSGLDYGLMEDMRGSIFSSENNMFED